MIEVKTVVEKEAATAFIRARGVMTDISPMFVMCATEKGDLKGVGAVSMTPECAVIEAVVCEEDLDWLIGKALLNALDLGGIRTVKILNPALFSLAEKLRFSDTDAQTKTLDLTGYFESGCGGKGVF